MHSPVLAALRPKLVPDLDGSERVGWYLSQWLAEVRGVLWWSWWGAWFTMGGGRKGRSDVLTVIKWLSVSVSRGWECLCVCSER